MTKQQAIKVIDSILCEFIDLHGLESDEEMPKSEFKIPKHDRITYRDFSESILDALGWKEVTEGK